MKYRNACCSCCFCFLSNVMLITVYDIRLFFGGSCFPNVFFLIKDVDVQIVDVYVLKSLICSSVNIFPISQNEANIHIVDLHSLHRTFFSTPCSLIHINHQELSCWFVLLVIHSQHCLTPQRIGWPDAAPMCLAAKHLSSCINLDEGNWISSQRSAQKHWGVHKATGLGKRPILPSYLWN